jgi:hypothetical protein
MKHLGVLGPPYTTHRCALPRVHWSGGSNFSVDCCVVSLLQQLGDPPLFFCTSLFPTQNSLKNIYVIHHRFTVQCHHSLLCLKTIVCSSNRRIAQGHCAWCIGQQQQQLCKGVGITQMIGLGFTLPFSYTNVGLFPLFDIFCSRCVCVCRL